MKNLLLSFTTVFGFLVFSTGAYAVSHVEKEIEDSMAQEVMPDGVTTVKELNIQSLDTNAADWAPKTSGVKADWGYSSLVTVRFINDNGKEETKKILFDTGQFENTVLDNVKLMTEGRVKEMERELSIAIADTPNMSEDDIRSAKEKILEAGKKTLLDDVEGVFISHHHPDHIGGLARLVEYYRDKKNDTALKTIYVGQGFWQAPKSGEYEHVSMASDMPDEKRKKINAKKDQKRERVQAIFDKLKTLEEEGKVVFQTIATPTEIFPGVHSTGIIPLDKKIENEYRKGLEDEQSLVIATKEGLVTISGCGHMGVRSILNYASRYTIPVTKTTPQDQDSVQSKEKDSPHMPILALIGGLHTYDHSITTLKEKIAAQFKLLRVKNLIGSHCTGFEPLFELRKHAGLKKSTAVVDTVGTTFSYLEGDQFNIKTLDLNNPLKVVKE